MTAAAPARGNVAVIDIGKTHARVALLDAGGATLATRGVENRVLDGPPYPHFDAEALWAFILGALKAYAATGPVDAVVAVAHGACAALADDAGLALPIMDYEWDGLEAVAGAYAALRPPFAETFSPPQAHGMNLGRQLFWQARERPQDFARARRLLTGPQYWAWRLSGVAAAEVTSLSCHSDLWAPLAARPSTLMAAQGWARLLPPLRPAWETLGPPRPAVIAATGLSPRTRVLSGAHDSNAALLPHLVGRAPPFAVVSTGTWIVAMLVGGDTARLDPAADMQAGVDVLGRPTPTAKFMGGREYAAIAAGDAAPTRAAACAVVASGALALPCFSAQGGPYVGREGRIAGDLPPAPGARAALASLYAALMTDQALDRLGAGGDVLVDGPFAANAAFMAALAALRPADRIRPAGEGPAAEGASGPVAGAFLLARWGRAPAAAADAPPAAPLAADMAGYRARWRAALDAR